MKKTLAAGIIAVGLIAAGGTGAYLESVKANTTSPATMMQQQGMQTNGMVQMMNSTNASQQVSKPNISQDSSFEQMLPYMKKMHPNMSDAQLKALYDQMHGPNGACSKMMGGEQGQGQGQGMMGTSTSDNL